MGREVSLNAGDVGFTTSFKPQAFGHGNDRERGCLVLGVSCLCTRQRFSISYPERYVAMK